MIAFNGMLERPKATAASKLMQKMNIASLK